MKQVKIKLTEQQVQLFHSLAQEIAQGYRTKEAILQALGISEQEYDFISQTTMFQRILQQAVTEWSAANNTAKRIRLKSQWAVEESIPYLFQSMTDTNEPLNARAEVFKALSKIGHLDYHEVTPGADRSFKIEINIAQGVTPVVLEAKPIITINSDPSETEAPPPAVQGFDIETEKDFSPGKFIPADPPTYSKS